MGRHSAPETDEELPERGSAGSQPTEPQTADPQTAEPHSADSVPVAAAVSSAVATASSAVSSTVSSAVSGTRGDLQLLRSDVGLLLRCAGAVVLLFLIYTSVLILIARTDVYLIWLWVPAVLSGMTVGGLLDRAHRRLPDRNRPAS